RPRASRAKAPEGLPPRLRLGLWLRLHWPRHVSRWVGQVDGHAAPVLLAGADVHADPAAAEASPANAPGAGAHADPAAAMALGRALEQDPVGAQRGRLFAQLAHHRVGLVLLAIGEGAARGLEQGDFFKG